MPEDKRVIEGQIAEIKKTLVKLNTKYKEDLKTLFGLITTLLAINTAVIGITSTQFLGNAIIASSVLLAFAILISFTLYVRVYSIWASLSVLKGQASKKEIKIDKLLEKIEEKKHSDYESFEVTKARMFWNQRFDSSSQDLAVHYKTW